MRRLPTAWFLASFSLLLALAAPPPAVAAAGRAQVPIVIASSAPAVDGTLGDPWLHAAHLNLGWDYTHGADATNGTDVYVTADKAYLYVAFDAKQRESVVATQQTNNVGEGSDDEVFVYLWPSGSNGFLYSFSANPRGTRYQSSTENTAYAPDWLARGTIGNDGYVVTMRIPLASIRGDGRGIWLAQFARHKLSADELDEWSHASGQATINSSIYAGALTGMNAVSAAARVKPRIAIYGLADAAASSAGGDTTRSGADISLPITQTASLIATIHPDFSNVEKDQQSIAPTAFRRFYSEVRPFFTQTANFLDQVSCYGCPYLSELYTPAIPTPRRGYAVEGVQGQYKFAAFDAVGDGRIDTSADATYITPDRHYRISLDRTSADVATTTATPAVHDIVSNLTFSYNDQHHIEGYLDYGFEQGTLATGNSQRYDGALGYYTKNDFISFSSRKIGGTYSPYDGFIQLSDIAGYSAQANHTAHFVGTSKLATANAGIYVDKYASTSNGTDLYDFNVYANVVTKSKVTLAYNVGTSYARLPGDILRPYTQTGGEIDYAAGSAVASVFGIYVGRYADGYLYSTNRHLGLTVAKRMTVNLQADVTDWHGQTGTRATQWLERASATYVIGRDSSVVVGARKITGAPPPIGTLPQPVVGTNLSFAFSQRRKNDELYLVYGDASAFTTRPGATLKYIHYFGAEKGT